MRSDRPLKTRAIWRDLRSFGSSMSRLRHPWLMESTSAMKRSWRSMTWAPAPRALLDSTLGPSKKALRDADVDPEQIEEDIRVGGSTRIPLVRRRVKELFKREPHVELNPDEVVAIGAAIQADVLSGGRRD